ncbi:hypothetical protein ILYODFUR_026616 [Ilyodon furcidens]|uniref:Uncharacterized protein n=1 Tax=Ilyodon furcidens TaxID=33524 RepID=A0ABV0U9D6_9TELE
MVILLNSVAAWGDPPAVHLNSDFVILVLGLLLRPPLPALFGSFCVFGSGLPSKVPSACPVLLMFFALPWFFNCFISVHLGLLDLFCLVFVTSLDSCVKCGYIS